MTRHRTQALLAVAVTVSAATALTGVASAGGTTITGQLCAVDAGTDPSGSVAPPNVYFGEMHGGPITVAELPPSGVGGNPVSVTLMCDLHTGGAGTYTDQREASVSASGTGVAVLPPSSMSIYADATMAVWMCMYVLTWDAQGVGETHYYDAATSTFSTDPNAHCVPQVVSAGRMGGP
jgi:hypothetical protein